jgi:hypothetical protein
MSYTTTQDIVKLPVYKDKVMYISATNSDYKIEQSYVISASFNGILRLSPNNYNTLNESNPVELSAADENTTTFSYSDAIVFDDSVIVDTGEGNGTMITKKVDGDIRRRMIVGSDSDGYLVNFRISDKGVEFDKLGVIGINQTKCLTIYSDDDTEKKDAFILGNTVMPTLSNSKCDTSLNNRIAKIQKKIDETQEGKEFRPEEYDEIKIKMAEDGDNSYILNGKVDGEGRRTFEFMHAQKFVRDVIMEALMSIKSVPTGSIHWFPVTYEQYVALINTDNDNPQLPNNYSTNNGTTVDPLVRDYLLCDGRKYKTKEFPELAKILFNENITYWDDKGDM